MEPDFTAITDMLGEPRCFRCRKTASELLDDHFMKTYAQKGQTPADFVKKNDGTYNPCTNHFACDACYIKIGMPTSPTGWRAP